MSTRSLAGACAVAAVLLAAPVTASARPADPPGSSRAAAPAPAAAPAAAPYEPTVVHGDGVATLTVLAIAGGALLAGAASGFEGGRIVARRGAVRS
jgi:hypothetical protein